MKEGKERGREEGGRNVRRKEEGNELMKGMRRRRRGRRKGRRKKGGGEKDGGRKTSKGTEGQGTKGRRDRGQREGEESGEIKKEAEGKNKRGGREEV